MTVATTERLSLRAFAPGDVQPMAAIYGDPEVMRHVGAGPVGYRDAVVSMLRAYADQHARHGWSFWAVEERASGALIGDAGLWPRGDEVELGYTLGRAWWGRGYATEAAQACLDVAAGAGVAEVMALADVANAASIHVLEKLGMRRDGIRRAHGRDHACFRLTLDGR